MGTVLVMQRNGAKDESNKVVSPERGQRRERGDTRWSVRCLIDKKQRTGCTGGQKRFESEKKKSVVTIMHSSKKKERGRKGSKLGEIATTRT